MVRPNEEIQDPEAATEPADGGSGSPDGRREDRFPACEAPDAFLAALVEWSDDAIIGKTLDGTIRSWNPGAERLFGYSAEEAIGQNIGMIVPPELKSEERTIHERLERGERVEQLETERLARDGRRVEVSVSISPIRNPDGTLVGASMVARDVTRRKRAEEAERRSRETLEAIIETAPVAINVLDRQGVVELWNPAAERIFGWSREEVEGGIPPAVSSDKQEEFFEHLEATFTGEPLEGKETTCKRKDGTEVRVALWSSVLEANGKDPQRLVSIAVDVSERKRAEASLRESEARFRSLADNIAQLAWTAHQDGWIFWFNKRWYDYTGTTPEDVEGWGWRRVHHPDHVDRAVERYRRAIEQGRVWEDTFPLLGANGTYRWFLSRAVPIRDDETGEITRWMGTNTDITERMEMEAALREADRRKDEFLATLAHELRNPLAPIRIGLELLREGGDDPDLAQRVLGTLERQSAHLVRMVDDLLDISRITRGNVALRRQEVDLSAAVHSAVETSRPLLEEGDHHLEVDLPEERILLDADPTRLSQVFSNLLNNAARYTPEGGAVSVSAERRERAAGGHEAVVRVRDSGQGIPQERLDQIFDLFVQGRDGTRHGQSGLGIGLTLVKSMVELHGGRVEAKSAGLGQGSEFIVHLPALPPGATGTEGGSGGAAGAGTRDRTSGRPANGGRPPAAGPRLRVVVADDNRDAADGLRELLEALGHRARAAYDGAEAVAAVREQDPQVVLLDLGMPNVDGYEAARRIRALPGGDRRILVAITGWGQDADRDRTREAGFDHHLVKPADLAELRRLLEEAADELE